MIKRKRRKQRQRLRNPRRRTIQKMGRLRPMRLRKLQMRRQRPRRRTRRQSSTTPVHPSVCPSILSLSPLSLLLSSSLFSSFLSPSPALSTTSSLPITTRGIFLSANL